MATIDNLSLNITAQSANAIKRLESLSNSLKALRSASSGSTVNNLTKLKDALSGLNRIKAPSTEKFKAYASGIKSVNNAASQISLASVNRLERLANALNTLGNVRSATRGVRSAIESAAIGSQVQESGVREVDSEVGEGTPGVETAKKKTGELSTELKRAKERANELRSAFRRIVGNAISQNFKGLSGVFEKIGNGLKKIVAPVKNLIRSLGRIALYRALRSLIKEITQGIKEGTDNLAKFSYLIGGKDTHNANKVLSQYSSNFLYLKNTLGTAVIPLLKTLEPLIDTIINKMVALIDVAAQLFSVISGSSTYTKAKYFYVDYAESLDKASGSAAKLNKQLAQFDELNNLTTSSGSGSGSDLEDVLQMFEDPVPIADWIKNLKNQSWEEVGKTLSDKFADTLNSIDWKEVYTKASNFGTNLASFFNGLIQPDTFRAMGKTLAGGIMTAIEFAFSFGDEFDFENLGLSIAEGINGFFKEFDGGKLADTIDVWTKGMFDTLKTAAKNIEWKEVFKDLFDFFTHLDIGTVALIVGTLTLKKGIGFTISIASGVLAELERKLIAWLATKVFPIKVAPAISSGASGTAAAAGGASVGSTIGAAILTAIGAYMLTNAAGEIGAMLSPSGKFLGLDDEEWAAANPFYKIFGKENVEGFFFQIFDSVKEEAIKWYGKGGIWDNFWQGFADKMTTTGERWYGEGGFWSKALSKAEETGTPIYGEGGFWDKIKDKVLETGETIYGEGGFWTRIWSKGSEIGEKIYGDAGFWANVRTTGLAVGEDIYGENGFWAKIEGKVYEVGQKIYGEDGFWANFRKSLSEAWNKVVQSFQEGWNKLRTFFGQNPISFGSVISNVVDFAGSAQSFASGIKLNGFASGGYPTPGSLFVAGEKGAELVGDFNGRTGVANNDQITEAMYAATYDAMSKALSENGMGVTIEGDADGMFKVIRKKASEFSRMTGSPAF